MKTKKEKNKPRAIVYCEGKFGEVDGKTANGLVRHSSKYVVCGIVDSRHAGQDAGKVLDGKKIGIPVYPNLAEALDSEEKIDTFIYGIAPDGGELPEEHRAVVLHAIRSGLNILNTMHTFLSEDEEISEEAGKNKVKLIDIRKSSEKPHFIKGDLGEERAIRVLVAGTDCAIGKRTTALKLYKNLKKKGVKVNFVATGQTGILQGSEYGIPLDAIAGDFMSGEVEHLVLEASKDADLVLIESQASLLHPLGACAHAIVKGAKPHAVIMQHAPMRVNYDGGFPEHAGPDLKKELDALMSFSSGIPLLAITINHEDMSETEVAKTIKKYEQEYGIPVSDVLLEGPDKIVDAILDSFPSIEGKPPKIRVSEVLNGKKIERLIDFVHINLGDYALPMEVIREDLHYCIKNGFIQVAYSGTRLVGVVAVVYTPFFRMHHVAYLAVAKFYRHRGIGKTLMNAAIKKAGGPISLNVDPDNENAFNFYRHIGFKLEKHRLVYSGKKKELIQGENSKS